MKLNAAILALVACTRPPTFPMPPEAEFSRAVSVYSQCGNELEGDEQDAPYIHRGFGTGVALDQQRVLTAAHVVACPEMPWIHVTLSDGRVFRMDVNKENDDRKTGYAILQTVGAFDSFDIPFPNPTVASPHGTVCAVAELPNYGYQKPYFRKLCGPITAARDGAMVFEAPNYRGESGAAVYDDSGDLVGIVQGQASTGGTFASYVRLP
jgi:S1-C subfamily serine protease